MILRKPVNPILALMLALVSTTSLWAASPEGPGISGGGNGLDGKPLESYAQAIASLPEYESLVAPALASLENKLPTLAQDIREYTFQKSWYFVPTELSKLRAEQIGVFFPTDQLALQTSRSVWINHNLYRWNSLRDKGTLLMHELVMALRLQDRFECIRRRRSYTDCALTPSDYDAVRHLTNVLLTQPTIEAEALSRLVDQLGFGKYNPLIIKDPVNPPSQFGLNELYLTLNAERDLKNLPRSCYYELELKQDPTEFTLNLFSRGANGEANRNHVPFSVKTKEAPSLTHTRDSITIETLTALQTTQSGEIFRKRLTVELTQAHVTRITGNWEQLVYNYRTNKTEWSISPSGPRYSFEPASINCIH